MSLEAGAQLGPYEILAPLGAGGMGEVSRAKDTRLDREVAVKVLPEEPFQPEPQAIPKAPSGKIMLAVLPSEDIGAEPQEWFSDGMTEEMIAQLGRLQPKKP